MSVSLAGHWNPTFEIGGNLSVDNRRPLRHNALGNDPEPELSPVWVRVPERDRAGALFWPELHMNLAMCNQVSTLTRIFLSAIRPRYRPNNHGSQLK